MHRKLGMAKIILDTDAIVLADAMNSMLIDQSSICCLLDRCETSCNSSSLLVLSLFVIEIVIK
jgi:hypothetical protein